MIEIISRLQKQGDNDSEAGNVNDFLRDVIVEVCSENYRQTMHEMMRLNGGRTEVDSFDLDPPLRANERVMSGLFATAISRVASRSKTEVRIDRTEREQNIVAISDDDDVEDGPLMNHGHVDFLAWYGNRVLGIELKMAAMNCEKPALTGQIQRRWTKVIDQAKTAQNNLRARNKDDAVRYPNPISLAFMVIVGRRRTSIEKLSELNKSLKIMKASSVSVLAELKPPPKFQAIYTFPEEFRGLVPKRKGKESALEGVVIFTPFVIFIAKTSINFTE